MTNHYLVDSLNNGLTRILKDIANTYDNVDFKDLSERYLIRASQKKAKRKGHVSAYNIFVRETRPSIVVDHPNLSFAEIAAHVSKRWAAAKDDKKHMADLDRKKAEYVQNGPDVKEPKVVAEPVAVPAPAPVAEPVKEGKKKKKPKA